MQKPDTKSAEYIEWLKEALRRLNAEHYLLSVQCDKLEKLLRKEQFTTKLLLDEMKQNFDATRQRKVFMRVKRRQRK